LPRDATAIFRTETSRVEKWRLDALTRLGRELYGAVEKIERCARVAASVGRASGPEAVMNSPHVMGTERAAPSWRQYVVSTGQATRRRLSRSLAARDAAVRRR
jgi:hypothetical protein